MSSTDERPPWPGSVPVEPDDWFRQPFITAFTDTVDLTAWRQRRHVDDDGRVDFGPRLYGRQRPREQADPDSTLVLEGRPRPREQADPDSTLILEGRARPSSGADRPAAPDTDYGLRNLDEEPEPEPTRRRLGSSRSRALWTLFDQVLSSGTNAVMAFIIARSVTKSQFGAFGIAFAVFSLVIGFSRAAGTAPLGIRYADATRRVFRSAGAAATGAALVVGAVTGTGCIAAGLVMNGPVGASLVAMGMVLPGLLLQDSWRQVFFAEGRPAAAAANDAVWAAVQFAGVYLLLVRHVTTSSPLLLAWGGAAAVAALLGVAQAGFWPAPSRIREWVAEHRDINAYMSAEYLTVQGAQQASTLLLGTLGAVQLVGALRGVQTLLGPTTILSVGIISWAVPEFSRRRGMTAGARIRAAYGLSALIVGVGLAWGTFFLFLPAGIGRSLLGDTWAQTHHLLGLSIIQQAGAAVTVGPACMLNALGRAKATFRTSAVFAPQLVAFPIIGLYVGGGTGAVCGYIAAFWSTVPMLFRAMRRAAREADSGRGR
jgi:O-antigen/teichoic acid export membrane protein